MSLALGLNFCKKNSNLYIILNLHALKQQNILLFAILMAKKLLLVYKLNFWETHLCKFFDISICKPKCIFLTLGSRLNFVCFYY